MSNPCGGHRGQGRQIGFSRVGDKAEICTAASGGPPRGQLLLRA